MSCSANYLCPAKVVCAEEVLRAAALLCAVKVQARELLKLETFEAMQS